MDPEKRKKRAKERMDLYTERVMGTFQLDPQVLLTLKNTTYTLEFNNRAVKDVLKDCRFNVLADTLGDKALESPEILGSLLHRGLQVHHPDLTIDDVDRLFTSRHYPYIVAKIREALDLFLPDLSDLPPVDEEEATADPLDP